MDEAYWVDEQESGPPTIEDDAWYQHKTTGGNINLDVLRGHAISILGASRENGQLLELDGVPNRVRSWTPRKEASSPRQLRDAYRPYPRRLGHRSSVLQPVMCSSRSSGGRDEQRELSAWQRVRRTSASTDLVQTGASTQWVQPLRVPAGPPNLPNVSLVSNPTRQRQP